MLTNLSNIEIDIVLPNYNSAPYLEETINWYVNNQDWCQKVLKNQEIERKGIKK